MKKFLLSICVALFSMTAQAQEKGDFAVGVHAGPRILSVDFGTLGKENVTQFSIGAFGQYNFNDHFRIELEATYHPKTKGMTDFELGANLHYIFHLTDEFKLYPLVGYGIDFTSNDDDSSKTDGGLQIGGGMQYNLGTNWFISAEYKFQPGVFGNGHVILGAIGYRF